jgi:hypothetical protein
LALTTQEIDESAAAVERYFGPCDCWTCRDHVPPAEPTSG